MGDRGVLAPYTLAIFHAMTASAASSSPVCASSAALHALITQAIAEHGGTLPFDAFMHLALYAPGLGYYARPTPKLGRLPQDGSDFVTAPEISPLFGYTLAVQVADALHHTHTDQIWEFGAGSGALAEQVLDALAAQGVAVQRYTIVEVSASLRACQQQRLARFGQTVQWVDVLPDAIEGVLLGNEVLDAMPVKLLRRHGGIWHERTVALHPQDGTLCWADLPTALRPPLQELADADASIHTHTTDAHIAVEDYLTEIHPQAQAFIATVGERLVRGAAFFIDYGFGEREYYHPQRHMGTLMCHHQHRADDNPLLNVGEKDITAHVNFTGIALAAQDVGLELLGYTTQGWFLLNCGLAQRMESAHLPERIQAQKLVMEHEMGELFKVIGFCRGQSWPAIGFGAGSRVRSL